MTLACGINLPKIAILFSALYGVFRCFYFAKNRYIGQIPSLATLTLLTIGAIYSTFKLILDVLSFIEEEENPTAAA